MHYFIPRLLTILSILVVVSFLSAAHALGGLLGGLVDTVDDTVEAVIQVDLIDEDEPEQTEGESKEDQAAAEGSPATDGVTEAAPAEETTPAEGSESSDDSTEQVEDEPVGETVETIVENQPLEEEEVVEHVADEAPPQLAEVVEEQPADEQVATGDASSEGSPSEPRESSRDGDRDNEVIETDDDLLNLDGEDKYIRIENPLLESVAGAAGLGHVGRLSYDVQESLLGSVTKTTGLKVDRFYLWTCIGEVCLPVDPITFNR